MRFIILMLLAQVCFAQTAVKSFTELKIKDGKYFTFTLQTNLATNGTCDILIKTPNKFISANMTFTVKSTCNGIAYLFDTFVHTNDGTQYALFNKNRQSSRVATTAVYHAPHVTNVTTNAANGTNAIQPMTIREICYSETSIDGFILQTNKYYLFKFMSLSIGTATIGIDYFED